MAVDHVKEVNDRILYLGRFKEVFERITEIMRSKYPCSVVIRGDTGSGKKTVIQEAQASTGVHCIEINHHEHAEDITAIRHIADSCGKAPKNTTSIADLIDDIRKRASKKKKLVIVLHSFEEFCRKRQCLLYNLVNLIQCNTPEQREGPNITIIGLTKCVDWAEDLEKRVRSRLNAQHINLDLPYQTKVQFMCFVSRLLGGYRIEGPFFHQLDWFYMCTNRSMRKLKAFLTSMITTGKNGELVLNYQPDSHSHDYQLVENVYFRERLKYLTIPQLNLVKIAVRYCNLNKCFHCKLSELQKFASDRVATKRQFDTDDGQLMLDFAYLIKLRIFIPLKPNEITTLETYFAPAIAASQFKIIIQNTPDLQHRETDYLWKDIRI